jgi:very-short-patch-repair endonuclease
VLVAAEVEGGTWSGGRHTRGSGFEKDAEKYNEAANDGWRVLRFTGGMIQRGEALQQIERALHNSRSVENLS